MNAKRFVFPLVLGIALLLFGVANAVAQTQSGTNSKANANSGAQASVVQNSAPIPLGFTNAVPGVAGETIPAMPVPNGHWVPYHPLIFRTLTVQELRRMAHGMHARPFLRHRRMWYTTIQELPKTSGPMHVVPWWPEAYMRTPHDKIVFIGTVKGKPWVPMQEYFAMALLYGMQQSHSHRCGVAYRDLSEVVTHNSAHGLGFQGAGSVKPGGDSVGAAGAIGFYHGNQTTAVEDYPEFSVVCLNPGPYTLPKPQNHGDKGKKASRKAHRPVMHHHEQKQLAPQPRPKSAPAPKFASLPLVPPAPKCAGAPNDKVLFAFNSAKVQRKYLPQIRKATEWLAEHPDCEMEVNGNTDTVGGAEYNALLGLRRANAVVAVMVKYGGLLIKSRIRATSSGKEYPVPGSASQSRRARIEVIGPSPGH